MADRKTILLVEDEALIAMTEQQELENYGYTVISARTGEMAVKALKSSNDIDLILMDIDLGKGMNGAEAADIILRERDIPVVFLSSHTEKNIVEKTEQITSYGYVVKNSGITVLDASIKMAFKLFDARMREKEINAALRLSEERFRRIFEDGSIGMMLAGADLKLFMTNQAFCRMLGYTPDEMSFRTFLEVTHPDHLTADSLNVERLWKGEIENYRTEKRYLTKNGDVRWGNLSLSLIRDQNGEPLYALGIVEDITNRKRSEAQLLESEIFLKETQKIARVGGWKANPKTDYLVWTEGVYDIVEAPYDYHPGLTEGMKYYPPEYIPLLKNRIDECLATGEPFSVEVEIITEKGRRLWTEVRGIAPVVDGERSYVMGTFQDITERRNVGEAMRWSEEKFYKIFESSPNAIAITRMPEGVFVNVNDSFEKMFGYCRDEVIGKTAVEINIWKDLAERDRLMKSYPHAKLIEKQKVGLVRKSGEVLAGVVTFSLIEVNGEYYLISILVDAAGSE